MAKKAKNPQVDGEDGDAAPAARGGRKRLILVALAVLVLLGGGTGGYFMLGGPKHGEAHAAAEAKKPISFVDVSEMIVNLASEPGQDRQRFLKLRVALEVKDPKAVEEVQPLLPRVVDIFQVFVRELRASDLEGSGGVFRLREELLRRVNVAVAPTRVDAVLFKEVVVQ